MIIFQPSSDVLNVDKDLKVEKIISIRRNSRTHNKTEVLVKFKGMKPMTVEYFEMIQYFADDIDRYMRGEDE